MWLRNLSDYDLAVALNAARHDNRCWREALHRARPAIHKLAQVTSTQAIPHTQGTIPSPLESEMVAAFYDSFPTEPTPTFTIDAFVRSIVARALDRERAALKNNPLGILPDDLSRVVPLIEAELFEPVTSHRTKVTIEHDAEGVPVQEHRATSRRIRYRRRRIINPQEMADAVNARRRDSSNRRAEAHSSNLAWVDEHLDADPEDGTAKVYRSLLKRDTPTAPKPSKRDHHDISAEHIDGYLALRGMYSLDQTVFVDNAEVTLADVTEVPEVIDDVATVEEVAFNVLASSLAPLQGQVMLATAMQPEWTEAEVAELLGVSVSAVRQAKKDARAKWRDVLGGAEGLKALIDYATQNEGVTV